MAVRSTSSATLRRSQRRPRRSVARQRGRLLLTAASFVGLAAFMVGIAHSAQPDADTSGDIGVTQAVVARPVTDNRVVDVDADYVEFNSLQDLAKASQLIVIGQASGEGKTILIQQPAQQPGSSEPAPPPSGASQDKANGARQHPSPAAVRPTCFVPVLFLCYIVRGKTSAPDPGLPETQFTVQITTVIQGRAPTSGPITVTQLGGPISLPTFPHGPMLHRTLVVGHDPLVKPGEEQVLFLSLAPNGTYYIVGGPQGRYLVQNGQVHPVAPGSPSAKGHDGETLQSFIKDIAPIIG